MCIVKLNYNNPEFYLEFKYDISSPSGLFRKNGEIAGTIRKSKQKSWFVKYKGVAYAGHRIIWFLNHGSICQNQVIDHIDGNSLNNNIKNLRLVTQLINNRNHKKQSNNKTGETGIYYEKTNDRYRVTWSINGINKSKSFSCRKYGKQESFEMAIKFRELKINESTNYSSRHGK